MGKSNRDEAWYRQPILWLGAVILAASLAGCIWMIVLAVQHPDELTHEPARSVLGVPLQHPASARSSQP